MRRLTAALTLTTTLTLIAGCSTAADNGDNGADDSGRPLLEMSSSEVIADAGDNGVETSARLFESSDVVIVAADTEEDRARGVHLAVAAGAPMLIAGDQAAVDAEIDRLGASRIITAGDVGPLPDGPEVTAAPRAATPASISAGVAASLDLDTAEGMDGLDHTEHPRAMPPMLATDETSLASIATARAAGAEVHVLSYPDPRITSESMALVSEQDVLALGDEFGSQERLSTAIDMAANGELPGGGGLVFPGRRMIAFYGHPSGDALGVMGEQPPAEAVERVNAHIENYQPLEEQPVIPAFEIIVTVASEFPGEDGKFTNVGNPEDFLGYIDAITDAGGYAFLDLQPGQASFLEQAQVYEELLKRPNVGLALDPEWNLQPGEQPLQRVGHAEAAEINEVSEWLAQLVRDNNLPQKGLIVHQFQMQMLRDRDQINTDHPELSFILHADGHGGPEQKFDTWNVMRQDLSDDWFMAWKNFIDEDNPTFTPEETYNNVDPRPWFVSYQ
ncbi:cell wall-binding repeat-containing protein [Corynebacterium sp.]|uniref:cell wall-binding repeat-containing protein n=1 Tax=Corynebacterium sp. TaxID=1720 RepID=UPI0026DF8EEB|nr:cell wall-binding repeat-containing protein [Corynebacterium sp.]MDO5511382.1 cell wall-binding repeat-containing protein [Corynebacterium sp.]